MDEVNHLNWVPAGKASVIASAKFTVTKGRTFVNVVLLSTGVPGGQFEIVTVTATEAAEYNPVVPLKYLA
ncbi:hypothetical protein D3C84_1211090 [compost metagenome]